MDQKEVKWSLYQKEEFLPPKKFSNRKTQEDVVKEILKEIEKGHKIIFMRGVCGSGKSAIALNLAKELGKASIVVPVKSLQKQYEDDYTNNKYLLNGDNKKLDIRTITGRQNFACQYLKENKFLKKELTENINTSLSDFHLHTAGEKMKKDFSADDEEIPCKIELKEKNWDKIRKYVRINKKVNDNIELEEVRRMTIAPVCPYWSPIVPSDLGLKNLEDFQEKKYLGLNGKTYSFYQRKKGCGFYDQYEAYLDADAIIFNSSKYKIETLMNRKPATEVEIIDECDDFLDSFSDQETINLNWLSFALKDVVTTRPDEREVINQLKDLIEDLKRDPRIDLKQIIPLNETLVNDLINIFLDKKVMDFIQTDEESYLYHCEKVAKIFEEFINETYVSFNREEKNIQVKLTTTNLEKRFKEMTDKNKVFLLMSGTVHSETVLEEIYGLKDYKIIDAETEMPGEIQPYLTGKEINCSYSNFSSGRSSRKNYLEALNECVKQAKRPTLIQVTSFNDLPSLSELQQYKLDLMPRETLRQLQAEDSMGEAIKKFKNKEIEILYSTKCNRGVDFPGDTCNSIILTKFPFPNVSSIFWQVLRKTNPKHYNTFYMDKARREFLQRIYRGLRFDHDHIYLLSPDSRVFEMGSNLFYG